MATSFQGSSALMGLLPYIACLPGLGAVTCPRWSRRADPDYPRQPWCARWKEGPSQGATIKTYFTHQPPIDLGDVRHSTMRVTAPAIIGWHALGSATCRRSAATAWEAPHEHELNGY